MLLLVSLLFHVSVCTSHAVPTPTRSSAAPADAVTALLERVLPGYASSFSFSTTSSSQPCAPDVPPPCFLITTTSSSPPAVATATTVSISGTSVSEVAAGLGYYLRRFANITVGWPRGGGSDVAPPTVPGRHAHATAPAAHIPSHPSSTSSSSSALISWPSVPTGGVARRRVVPWSYFMNVCTHSYSLVWYSWAQWEALIDWMALSGINNVLGMTGQEEVQYKVLTRLGLNDSTIRGWFNGPAFLTWSRGQNEYGAGIAGPLPRSWMRAQWELQRMILTRYRSLGIVAQLPGFQGNVPAALKEIRRDANMTVDGGTAWIDSLDPLFAEVAAAWMAQLIADFGTDHWYQLDGYFNGRTAPWLGGGRRDGSNVNDRGKRARDGGAEAVGGSVYAPPSAVAMRAQSSAIHLDPTWYRRGAAAYRGLNATDPNAVWSYQGWAFVGWPQDDEHGSWLSGFVDSAPPGKFNVIDMEVGGRGEWRYWNDAAFFGAKFIWTSLHDFGGNDGLKGNLSRANEIPFLLTAAPGNTRSLDGADVRGKGRDASFRTTSDRWQRSAAVVDDNATGVWGTGFTPEGIDQNPVYYELLLDNHWATAPQADIPGWAVDRALRRYRLTGAAISAAGADGTAASSAPSASYLRSAAESVAAAWRELVVSAYSQDLGVHDDSGVLHLPGTGGQWAFYPDRRTPTVTMCGIVRGARHLVDAAKAVQNATSLLHVAASDDDHTASSVAAAGYSEPLRYDVVNTVRELLAQLSTPLSQNFSDAANAPVIDAAGVHAYGDAYIAALLDLDRLLMTDTAFLLGPWLAMARAMADSNSTLGSSSRSSNISAALSMTPATDCSAAGFPEIRTCPHFYDWNARCQITTWNPTSRDARSVPDGPVDYAGKQWSGLISDYYVPRARLLQRQALLDAAAGRPLDTAAVALLYAQHAYTFTTANDASRYPLTPSGDAVNEAAAVLDKYGKTFFASC